MFAVAIDLVAAFLGHLHAVESFAEQALNFLFLVGQGLERLVVFGAGDASQIDGRVGAQVGCLLAAHDHVAGLRGLHQDWHRALVARKVDAVLGRRAGGGIGLLVLERIEQHVHGFLGADEAERDEDGLVLARLGGNLESRRERGHGLGGAQVAQNDGGLVRCDAGAVFVKVELLGHLVDFDVLLVEQLDERLDGGLAHAFRPVMNMPLMSAGMAAGSRSWARPKADF